jgi:hypothetical protein
MWTTTWLSCLLERMKAAVFFSADIIEKQTERRNLLLWTFINRVISGVVTTFAHFEVYEKYENVMERWKR